MMPRSFRLDATRRQTIHAIILIAMLIVPIAWAWEPGGPPPDKVVRLILIYFIEIAVFGAVELIRQRLRRPNGGS